MNENEGTPADIDLLATLETDSSFVDLDGDEPSGEADAESDEAGAEDGSEDDASEGAGDDAGSEDDKPEGEDDDEGDEDEPEPEPAKKKLSGSQRQKQRIAALEAQLAEATATAKALPVGDTAALATEVEKVIGPAPKESDFENFLDYERERTAYELDKRQVTREIKARAENAAATVDRAELARRDELVANHGERLDALEKALPGSREKLKALATATVQGHVVQLMLDSDKSALLALHIAENPSILTDLNGMSESRAAREIGRLEAKLSLPKPKTATKAPAPVRAVKGAASPSTPDGELGAWLKKQYGG